jgi:hypothetical protein
MTSERNGILKPQNNMRSIAIRHRGTGRIMKVLTDTEPKIHNWINNHNNILSANYNVELLGKEKYPIGLPGRDKNFPDGLVISIPPIPPGTREEVRHYSVKTRKMSPFPVVECLKRFGPEICIVAGELNCRVYTKEFMKTICDELDRAKDMVPGGELQFKAQIVCGPVAMIKKGFSENRASNSILPELLKNPDIELYYSYRRQKEHFRLAPMAVYTEGPHPPNAVEREGHRTYFKIDKLIEYQNKKINILSNSSVVRLCKSARDIDKFIFLTENELKNMVQLVNIDSGNERDFDDLDNKALKPYLNKMGLGHLAKANF